MTAAAPSVPDRQLLSVNVGQPTTFQIGPRPHVSGIDKRPLPGRARVTGTGLEGDHVMDTANHGGPDQAVYLYAHWEAALGRALPPGLFGENLLVGGLESAAMRVGDRLEITGAQGPGIQGPGAGGTLLEVTAPRIPCAKLAAHVGDPAFVRRFVAVGRPGFYTRVLRGGDVGAGDRVRLIPGSADAPTIGELFALWYDPAPDLNRLRQYLRFPLAVRVRARVQGQLAEGRGALSP